MPKNVVAPASIEEFSIPEGTTTMLVCETSVPMEAICWYKGEELIEESQRFCQSTSETGTQHSLEIRKATVNESAEYGVIMDGRRHTVAKLQVTG